MQNQSGLVRIKRKTILYFVLVVLILAIATPALAAYLGPNRTVTETTSSCKVVLYECRYVPAKDDYRYKRVEDWSCSNESKPWKDYDSSGPACEAWSAGRTYWEQEETQQEVTTTYPEATIKGLLQSCTLQNGWCTTSPQLSLNGTEPVSGYRIIAIEGSINGQTFACANSTCTVPLNQGNNTFTYWALSSWGDSSTMGTLNAKVDSQLPNITGTFSGTSGTNGWYLSPITFNGTASDSTSGLASFTCTLDGVALGSCNSITINSEGAHTLVLNARDNAGNKRTLSQNTSLDTQDPILNASLNGTLGSNNWYTNATLNAAASDPSPGSGLSTFEYNLDNNSWITFPTSGVLTLPEGKHSIDIIAKDNAGRTVSSSKSFWLDKVPPSLSVEPTGAFGANDWYTTTLNISASTNDDTSGVDIFEYSLDNSAWTTYQTPLTIGDGSHDISFWAQDAAGLVTQVDRTYKVDTRIPQIAGSLSGNPGTNGWYTSDVTLSSSASDPAPGSGLDAFTYSLNGQAETSYTNALILSDGEHTVQLKAQDKAGLIYTLEQRVKVDTIHPSLNIQTILPSWIKDTVTITGTSTDSGSGLFKVEISTDGGQTWEAVTGTLSWSYVWDTFDKSNGIYELHVRTTDNAGLTTEQAFNAAIDNSGPKISMPDSWYQWDTVTLDVWDNHSGLSEVRVEISDPDGRWPTRKIDLDPESFPLEFKWDRRFGDDTIAPLGSYGMKVIAFDKLGHLTRKNASINILLGILPAGQLATPQPYVRLESISVPAYAATPIVSPIMTQAPVRSDFGSTLEPYVQGPTIPETSPTPRSTPTQINVLDWLQSIFIPNASEETVTEIGLFEGINPIVPQTSASGSNLLWGATAAAMIGSVTAYALEERRKQQEEQARQAALEAQKEERHEKMQARKMEKLEIQWAQERAWEEARLEQQAKQETAKAHLIFMESEKKEMWVAKPAATLKQEQTKKAEELQAGLAAYYNAIKQGEKESSNTQANWWENTKSFVNEKIIEPLNTNIYQPYTKPAMEKSSGALTNTVAWLDTNVFQPYINPVIEKKKQDIVNDFEWIKENVYQPHLKPALEKTKQFVISESTWINENIVQPYATPVLKKVNEAVSNGITWANDKVYQPYIKPAVEKAKAEYPKYVSWVNEAVYEPFIQPIVTEVKEKVYEPFIEPVVSDINQYIVEPYIKPAFDEASAWWQDTWNKYGEWVHGALDTVGFIPGLGEIADGLNGLIYLGEGRYIEAGLSLVSMIPIAGDLSKVGKWGLKMGQEILETATEKVTKVVAETIIAKATKESLDEVAEIAFKEIGEELAEKAAKESLEQAIEKTVHEASEELVEKVSQTATEKTLKEGTEQLASQVAKESVEEIAEKTVKETGEELVEQVSQTVAEKATKEIADEVPANVVKNIDSPVIPAQNVSKTPAQEKIEEILGFVDEETAQLITNLQVQHGDEMVGIFLPLCEKYGINPHDILTRPPTEGQSLIGWLLGIEDPINPVNHALASLNLTHADLDNILLQSIKRPESSVVVLGYGKGVAKPYFTLSDEINGCHLSLSSDVWSPFENAKANFWTGINAPFIEKAIENRKVFLFNINYDEIVDAVNVDRFSLPELRLIEMEINNYVSVPVGDYAAYVPIELLDTYEQYLPASLLN